MTNKSINIKNFLSSVKTSKNMLTENRFLKSTLSSSYLLSLVKGKMYINIHVYEDENDSHPIEQK